MEQEAEREEFLGLVLWLNSVIKDLDFFLAFWPGSSSYWLLVMGLSPHGPKVAATAPGFPVPNANESRKQCVHQYIKKETFLCVFFYSREQTFPRSPPAQNWITGPLLRVRGPGTVMALLPWS